MIESNAKVTGNQVATSSDSGKTLEPKQSEMKIDVERRLSNGREGTGSDEHQKPHAPHAQEPSRAASNSAQDAASDSTSGFAQDSASESHVNVQGEEMAGSKKKDAQKRECSTLQSLLSAHGREDSPKTSVNGQTSRMPLHDKNEPTPSHPDCKVCPLYRDELAAFISWAQNRIRKERKRLADYTADKRKIDCLILIFE